MLRQIVESNEVSTKYFNLSFDNSWCRECTIARYRRLF